LHERLQVRKAVLEREADVEHVRMLLDGFVAVLVRRGRALAARDADAHRSGERERAQPLRVVAQVAEALAEEYRRRDGAEGLGADALRAARADVPVHADGRDGLALVVLVELV